MRSSGAQVLLTLIAVGILGSCVGGGIIPLIVVAVVGGALMSAGKR